MSVVLNYMDNQTPIQLQMPVQPTPQPVQSFEPKESLPKWPLIIIGVILILVLIGGAFTLGKNMSVTSKSASKTPATQTITKATTTTTPDPTADWQTYANPKYPFFSFKYPSNFKITETPENYGNHGDLVDPRNLLVELKDTQASNSNYAVEILTSPGPTGKDFIDSWFGEIEGGPSNIKMDFINSHTVYRFFMQKAGIGPAGSAYIMFQSGPTVVAISTGVKDGQANEIMNDNMLNEIASTLKFTGEQNSAEPLSKEGESCGANAGAGGNAQCAPGLTCANIDSTTKIGTCIKQ